MDVGEAEGRAELSPFGKQGAPDHWDHPQTGEREESKVHR